MTRRCISAVVVVVDVAAAELVDLGSVEVGRTVGQTCRERCLRDLVVMRVDEEVAVVVAELELVDLSSWDLVAASGRTPVDVEDQEDMLGVPAAKAAHFAGGAVRLAGPRNM